MKVSLNTAQYYAGDANLTPNGPDALIGAIGAQLGAIEDVTYYGPKYDGIVVAKVISCIKHTNADKLHICTVDDGGVTPNVARNEQGYVQVVCGAPNVREGLLVAWIPPGATVPTTYGTSEPFVLDARELRGEVSNGMLASASELGISDNHDGLLEINPKLEVWSEAGAVQPTPGMPFKKLYGLDDIVFDLENKMFTHRPDCFGVLGVARELAGIQGQTFKSPDWYLNTSSFTVEADVLPLDVQILEEKNVPRLMGLAMSGLTNGASPVWMQAALTKMGIRPISAIVDITNFIMQLTGQPLHAYDYDKLAAQSGAVPTLLARAANNKEQLELLSGKVLELGNDAVVIATDKQAIGLAGIMGGANTEVDGQTTRVVIEVASFDMYNIRRSCMKYGVFSDAATRFNKGQSTLQNDRVLRLAADMLAEHCGAKIASNAYDVQKNLKTFAPVTVSTDFINVRLGSNLTPGEIADLLNRTELATTVQGSELTVTPPFWRTDIELKEDIVEEVGRLYGFDKLPIALPRRVSTASAKDSGLAIKQTIRAVLSAAGANEVLTYNFIHGNLLDAFDQPRDKALQLSNALSPDLQYYRMSLLPNVLDKVHSNIKAGFSEFALFELGKTHNNFHLDEADFNLPKESNFLAFVYTADAKTAKQKSGAAYYQALKGLDYLLAKLGVSYSLKPITQPVPDMPVTKPYDITRSAYIISANGENMGMIGEIQAGASKKLKLPDYTAGFELDTDMLAALQGARAYTPSSKFPKIEQDICLEVADIVPFSDLQQLIQTELANTEYQAQLTALDIWQQDGANTKRITFSIALQHPSRTMTTNEGNVVLQAIATAAAKKYSAVRI